MEMVEAVGIMARGGKFLVTCSSDGEVTGFERARSDQYLLTLEEFKEMQQEAGAAIDSKSKRLP